MGDSYQEMHDNYTADNYQPTWYLLAFVLPIFLLYNLPIPQHNKIQTGYFVFFLPMQMLSLLLPCFYFFKLFIIREFYSCHSKTGIIPELKVELIVGYPTHE